MNATGLRTSGGRGVRLVRVLLVTNFILLLALIGPGSSHKLYLAQKRLGIAHIITHSLQFWFVTSTVLAIALFVRVLVSKSAMSEAQRPTKLDWALFLGWVSMAAIVGLFAFAMGMGG